MAIQFRDFFPESRPGKKALGFIPTSEYEPVGAIVDRVNDWLREAGVRVVNVETVLLPEVRGPEDAETTHFTTSSSMHNNWYQFVRVWYEEPA